MTAINQNMCIYRVRFFSLCLFILTISFAFPSSGFGQGIKFTGSNQPIEKRTSAAFFADVKPTFHHWFTIDFDLQLPSDGTMGYIVRIKEKNQGAIFNLHYDEEEGQGVFRLNEEGKTSLITIRIALGYLVERHWFPVRMDYDLQKGEIKLQIADEAPQVATVPIKSPYSPNVTFGRSDYMIDVPSFSLRNFRIGNKEKEIVFPLLESSGNKLHNASGEVMGKVTNGTWLLNDAFHWYNHTAMHSSSPSGSAYDPKRKSIYYFNSDSLQIYEIQTGVKRNLLFSSPCPMRLKLGNSFINHEENRLYVYETYYEEAYVGPTVVSLDLTDFSWRIESSDYLQRELNHHASYFLPDSRKLLLFGGYGKMVYSNDLLFYDLTKKRWSAPERMRGDSILPRYFTSTGISEADQKIYIFGGMGNESGQHIVGRRYFYDLYTLDPTTQKTTKIWDVDRKENLFVPARGLVIPDSNWIYMLGYPEHLTHSFIKLRRFAIRDGEYEELGDSIPIYSDKISTHANLYFDRHLNKLIALVQESDDDIRSSLTVYSLDFPAISESQLHAFPSSKKQKNIGFYVLALGIICIGIFVYRIYRRPKHTEPVVPLPDVPKSPEEPQINRIYLFGDFTVVDKRGMDVSHLFSARLQQVFCLILFHSHSTGISSNLLTHLLWPDKPKDKAKTSRGVAINNLRKVLSELDGIEIVYEEGHYRVVFESCYCDYWDLKELLTEDTDVLSPKVLSILERGEFLLGMDDPIFDKSKYAIESMLIDKFQKSMAKSREDKDWSTLFRAADALLTIDTINELALEQGLYALYKRKLEPRAALFYKRFTENYRRLMGEDYGYTFDDIWRRTMQ
ncbi:Kelch repeat-containing protein [Sphingobacterium haloxyli]|uniref:DNA-binding transcriptional activator n=1 Tax=Sphingobacterium haloxyli TaxID=2100533 RepID=A0A2S9J868_9SPHI|nr:kelch repeat-containing protein [Sphingobacterium haloxyli]PRD48986.1 DNA-binding transcriptional activator [Sphingobacterium haloxyli]